MGLTGTFGTLTDYATGEAIRPATAGEWRKTADALNGGTYTGAFQDDDGHAVWVDGGPETSVNRNDIIALAQEAMRAGDTEMARIGNAALNVNGPALTGAEIDAAWGECVRVILDNRANSAE